MLYYLLAHRLLLTLVHVGILAAAEIEGPLRRLLDGGIELAFRQGLLDGFLAGSILTFLLIYRRRSCVED